MIVFSILHYCARACDLLYLPSQVACIGSTNSTLTRYGSGTVNDEALARVQGPKLPRDFRAFLLSLPEAICWRGFRQRRDCSRIELGRPGRCLHAAGTGPTAEAIQPVAVAACCCWQFGSAPLEVRAISTTQFGQRCFNSETPGVGGWVRRGGGCGPESVKKYISK